MVLNGSRPHPISLSRPQNNEEEFLDCSMSITSMWSEPAVSYFERQLKSDIIKYAGKWLLEEFD
jgi:hypothetical protein